MAIVLSEDAIKKRAQEIGFCAAKFCDVRKNWQAGQRLSDFVDAGFHGQMQWLETTLERRSHPNNMWEGAISAIVLGTNYAPHNDPLLANNNIENANISAYAKNNDYHDLIKKRLKILAGEIHHSLKCEVKVFVDTAPLMEKPLAQLAGLGWQGKHTNLVSREFGSYLFLGTILVAHEFNYDVPEINHCGTCTACIDICPTRAIIAPNKLDARKCISYLTIEHNGAIDDDLMNLMGNHIYGCDDCTAICPWNKFAIPNEEIQFLPRPISDNQKLEEYLQFDDAQFRTIFSKSPIKRIGLNRFLRNVLIAIGNCANEKYIEKITPFLHHIDEGVKKAAQFAINKLKN
jgi:epoxyqueuosine reductase